MRREQGNQAGVLPFQRVGADVAIWPTARIVSPETISIGDSVLINDFVFLAGGQRTTIGSFVHIAPFVLLAGGGECTIGDFVGISAGSRIYSGNDDYLGGGLTGPAVPEPFRAVQRSFVQIRRHAILGANAVVLPGVVIGEGAAVGAGSIVKRDCEPWTIYAGAPARPLKTRPAERILRLEAELRRELYDAFHRYIPRSEREADRGRRAAVEPAGDE